MPSANVLVSDNGGAFTAPGANGVVVNPNDPISIKLANAAGVSNWQLTCIGTDETSTAPVITPAGTGNSLRNLTVGGLGTAIGLQSTVYDNSTPPIPTTTTFGIFVLTSGGQQVLFVNQRFEGNATFGWVSAVNPYIRGGATTPPWTLNTTLTATPGSPLARAIYQVQPVIPAAAMSVPLPLSPVVGDLVEIPDWLATSQTTGIWTYTVTINPGGTNAFRNPHTRAVSTSSYPFGQPSQDVGGSRLFARWTGSFWDAWIIST